MISKSKHFRSNGKLLITAEYVVLDGAKALAIPTKYGQSLTVELNTTETITWKSYNELGAIWFEAVFTYDDIVKPETNSKSRNEITERLLQILNAAQSINPEFLNTTQGYDIRTHQDFNRLWGLGTSSTLINNIANWAQVDAYKLLEQTFGGSGYDIACAQHNTPIRYKLNHPNLPFVNTLKFEPLFRDELYFVYLNQKQDSRDGIATYKKNAKINPLGIEEINSITEAIITCKSLEQFETLLQAHETIISKLIRQDPIKSRLFSEYEGAIKSLGCLGRRFCFSDG